MNSAPELIRRVEAAGGRFMVDGGRLGIVPATAAASLMDELRQHKAEIISLLEPASIQTMSEPIYDPADWREAFSRWLTSDCVAHWRLHGGVGRLHVAFSENLAAQGEVPCSRAVFEALLRGLGWEIHPTLALVAGLMLRKDLDGDEQIARRLM